MAFFFASAAPVALLTNGQNDMRHHIDHSAQIHPDDYGRFAETGTIVGFSAFWATPNPYEIELALPLLGQERWANSYPIKSVMDQGAMFISGSDWPVSTMNPFQHFAAAMSRIDPINADRGPLNVDEAVSLDAIIASYTINSAYVMHQEDITGSVEIGKSADLIVLDRNIFEISIAEIRDTQVERTLFKGQTVFAK